MNTDRKPHIGFLTERMTLGFGVDVVIHEQAMRFVNRGYKVTVFPGWMTDLYEHQPYNIVPLTDNPEEQASYFSPEFLSRSFDTLNKHKVDVWMIHTPPFYNWLSHLPPPVILVEHGTPPGKYFSYRQGKRLDAETKKRQKNLFRSRRPGDGLVAISEYIRSDLPLDVQRSTVVIHNGADHYARVAEADAIKYRAKLKLKPSDIMVLWVGRIQPIKDPQPYKGLSDLLRIAEELKKKSSKIKLVAVGRGENSVIATLKNAGILPLLNLPRKQMATVYAAADIFLNTSSWEGFNLPLAESQFQGTPVVALKVCAHPEVVANGFSGLLVDRVSGLTDAVLELASNSRLRHELGSGALKHVSEFSWNKNVDKLEKLISACLKVVESGSTTPIVQASLKKNMRYYIDFSTFLIQHFGWKTLFTESFSWVKRRLPVRSKGHTNDKE
jgi:glycosyltransferase involved in cell wall biosynthesis